MGNDGSLGGRMDFLQQANEVSSNIKGKICKYTDAELFGGMSLAQDDPLEKKEENGEVIQPKLNTRKISTDEGKAQIWVTDDYITIVSSDTGIGVTKDNVIIAGRLAIKNAPSEVRINGFWVLNEEILTCLPSTTYTPIPMLVYKDPPYAKRAGALLGLVTGTG